MELVRLVVLAELVLDVLGLQEVVRAEHFADVVEDFVEFTDWGALDEVFADLDRCHIVKVCDNYI